MTKLLNAIDTIPMAVVNKGQHAIIQWFNTHTEFRIPKQPRIRGRGIIGCIYAIGAALFVPAKLLKVKKVVDAFGGVAELVDALRWAFSVGRSRGMPIPEAADYAIKVAAESSGKEVFQDILQIFGVGLIYEECFDD